MISVESRRILPLSLATFKNRSLVLVGTCCYIAAYQLLYITYLSKAFGYYGFEYQAPPLAAVLLGWALSLIPVSWSPIELSRPSQLIYWVVYFTVFIPTMFVPLYVRLDSLSDIISLMLTTFAGFSLLRLVYFLPIPRFRGHLVSSEIFWILFALVDLALLVWLFSAFHGNLHLVDFSGDVYEVRSEADAVLEGSKAGYAITWLIGSINPFLMARGLVYKKRLLFFIGAAGQLFVYSTAANKSAVLSVAVVLFLYLLVGRKASSFVSRLSWGLAGGLVLLYGLSVVFQMTDSIVLMYLLGITVMRTIGITGLFSAQYYNFFHYNQFTYFSHVAGPSFFIRYPYEKVLGLEIGQHFSGLFGLNSNAHFWATDGIAAMGLPGILVASVACAVLFWILDASANGHRVLFTALAYAFAAINLTNTSLFTTFLSGGMFLSVFFLLLLPKDRYTGATAIGSFTAAKVQRSGTKEN